MKNRNEQIKNLLERIMNEFELIEKIFKPLSDKKSSFNLSDDIARISLKPDEELIVSKDLLIENTHFLRDDCGYKIAKKSLLSNLSDIASSGATPVYYMLGFGKNNNLNDSFYKNFAKGLKEIQKEFKIKLIGGDTVNSKEIVISITIFAKTKKNKILLRKNAKSGDLIFVSGFIGDSYLGLKNKENKYLHDRHFFPSPRIELGQKLLKNNLSKCAIDISDGFFLDLQRVCKSSKLTAEIFLNKIPISLEAKKHLKNNKITIFDLLSGGEDYELIFTVNKKDEEKILRLAKNLKINLTCVGNFKKTLDNKRNINLFDDRNNYLEITKLGYEH